MTVGTKCYPESVTDRSIDKAPKRDYTAWWLGLGTISIYLLFTWLLPVTDPVESNYALTAREMLLRGDYMTPYIYGHPWFDKPIWTYWMLIGAYNLFGFTDFAARLPGVMAGGISVGLMYYGVKRLFENREIALSASLITGTFFEFWYITHAVITDQYLFLFSMGTFFFAYWGLCHKTVKDLCLAYAFAGLAVLDKGPVGLVLPGLLLIAFLVIRKDWHKLLFLFHPWGLGICMVIALPWYWYMYMLHGWGFMEGFLGLHNYIRATVSEHPHYNVWYYYLVIWLLGLMPWNVLVVYGLRYAKRDARYWYSFVWAVGVILFYTCMATKYSTYTYISLIPFGIFGALGLQQWQYRHAGQHVARWQVIALIGSAAIFFILAIVVAGIIYLPATAPVLLLMLVVVWGILWWAYRQERSVYSWQRYTTMAVVVCFIVVAALLSPIMSKQSGKELARLVPVSETSQVYFYKQFSASYVYYSGHMASLLRDSDKPATNIWTLGKEVMPLATPSTVGKEIAALPPVTTDTGQQPHIYIFVDKDDVVEFEKLPMHKAVRLYALVGNTYVYIR